MASVLVVAGTSDARQIITELLKANIRVNATVTTSLGRSFLQQPDQLESDRLTVYEGALDAVGMAALIEKTKAVCLVDASHPFAEQASLNASRACELAKRPYMRFERADTPLQGLDLIKVPDFKAAASQLRDMSGNILLTVGSHNLETFTSALPDFKDRLFVRVLPASQILAACEQLGLPAKNIIALKGPFSEEMNVEMLKYCQARIMVTKESGDAGGTLEKIRAANRLGVAVLLIERPQLAYGSRTGHIPELMGLVLGCIKHLAPNPGDDN